MSTGIAFQSKKSVAELRKELEKAEMQLAACRESSRGNVDLFEAIQSRHETDRVTGVVDALAHAIRRLENAGREEAAVRNRYTKAESAIRAADREIETLIAQRKESLSQVQTAERRAKSLSISKATSDLKMREGRELELVLTDIGRLRNVVRMLDDEIAERQASRNLLVPAFQQAQKEVDRLAEQKHLDELSTILSDAVTARVEAENAVAAAWQHEHICRLNFQIANDAIQTRRHEEQRLQIVEVENARRQQRGVTTSLTMVSGHI